MNWSFMVLKIHWYILNKNGNTVKNIQLVIDLLFYEMYNLIE